MLVAGKPVKFQVDTGASVNILPACYAPHTTQSDKKLTMLNGNQYIAYSIV